MKKLIILVGVISLGISTIAQAQDKKVTVKNLRSSLHTMVIESDNFPRKEVVLKAFNDAPFPDKYNEHTIGEKSFNPVKYTLSAEEKAIIYKSSEAANTAAIAAGIKIDSVANELPYRIQKYLSKEKIANKLVAKWFNRQVDGSLDWNLVAERGIMNASDIETKNAKSSSEGQALLKNIGLELIGNTFVVVNKFNFFANEPVAAAIRDLGKAQLAKQMAGQPQFVIDKLNSGIDAVYEKGKEGYSIFATSYLYKLVWNDSIATIFYSDLYMEKDKIDAKKKNAFDNSDLFKLEFVGDETAVGLITFSLKEKRTEEQIVSLSTKRIIDKVYAKLQKKYDVFKTLTELLTGNPITAKIGTKEGLVGGEKFDVLEKSEDPKTGLPIYKSIGTIKVDKNLIWDNLYNDEVTIVTNPAVEGQTTNPIIEATTFIGGKKYYPGILIKQIK